MIEYCKQDVELTHKVYNELLDEIKEHGFSQQSVELEHDVAAIVGQQERDGFLLDVPYTLNLLRTLQDEFNILSEELIKAGPKTVKVLKTKVKVDPFNPGSRTQVGQYLISLGWKPKSRTPTGRPVVDESTLADFDHPAARKFEKYFLLQKRIAQIGSWVEAADGAGRVHGRVITNGAITGRMTHYGPNMAQVPAVGAPLGYECRRCFVAPPGRVLVGIDASGLELRMLAHYMKDAAYVKTVCEGSQEKGTDIHTVNQLAAGLSTRAQAKTFIYALLYGAGPGKIGDIVGGTAADGVALIDTFLAATPALQKLRQNLTRRAEKGKLPGLDGRVLWVRSEHSTLNTLLQGAGAISMKQALVFFNDAIKENGYDVKIVANIHDEWQVECNPDEAEHIGQLGTYAIEAAGRHLNLRCPLTGEYRVGQTWAETH